MDEDPKILYSIPAPSEIALSMAKISPNGKTILGIQGNNMYFFESSTGKLVEKIEGSHIQDILGFYWTPDSNNVLTFCGSKFVFWWKNPTIQ
jgi:hypothetical protein